MGQMARLLCLLVSVVLAASCVTPGPANVAVDHSEEKPPFQRLMTLASFKRLLVVDTVAGKTKVLLTSSVENPGLVIVHAAGGDGNPTFTENDGIPGTQKGKNPMFLFGAVFLERKVAWAAVDVPADYGAALRKSDRMQDKHVKAFAQASQGVRLLYPKAKLVLMGHSNGGITAGMQSLELQPVFDGIVLASPNLVDLSGWDPTRAKVPLMFITHEKDFCALTRSSETIKTAGGQFPIVVVKTPSRGPYTECRVAPAPHFFSDVQGELADAVIAWASKM
jgi:hypothetical protein